MAQWRVRDRFTNCVQPSVVEERELREHLERAEGLHLLLSAVHVTRDLSLLDRHAAKLSRPAIFSTFARGKAPAPRGTAEEKEAFDREEHQVRAELIELLCSVLTKREQQSYLGAEDFAALSKMADVAAGSHIDEQFLAMCLEQAGFEPDERTINPTKVPPKTLNLAIIGAGMTGLDAAVKASDRGFEFEVFDMESGIGGLWWSQTYPGVAVDTPSALYSLSYDLNPEWSKFFPLGEEYQRYLIELAKKFELTDHLHFNSEITRMEWIDADQVWELTVLDTAEHTVSTVRAAAVVTGAGHLNRPKYPDVVDRESFAGASVHTARWRDVDLEGKRVGVVGVGAAGIQVIAAIADSVEHLTVFQRQAHWVSPNRQGDGVVSDDVRWLRRHLPFYMQWERFLIFWIVCEMSYALNKIDPEWMKDHPKSISPANDLAMQASLNYINGTFGEGSELARKLTPDFVFGGKRPVRDPGSVEPGGYYYALMQPHVELVTDPLARVLKEGIATADGAVHELDVIIWATGMTLDFLSTIEIVGRDGVHLSEVWADNNPRSYLGGTVPGFPNLFINDGPNTGVATGGGGHNFMTETVDHYIFEALQLVVEKEATSIEVTQQAHDEHNELIESLMEDLIWTYERRADTYYRNQAGRIILPSPFSAQAFWNLCHTPDEAQFIFQDRAGVPTSTSE